MDYSESLIAARKALLDAEYHAQRGDWLQMAHAAEQACLHAIQVESWADAKLRE